MGVCETSSVGPPAEQERVGAPVDLVHDYRGFIVEVRPSAALESAALILLWPAGPLHDSVNGDLRGGRQFHGRGSLRAGSCRRTIRPDRGPDLACRSRVRPADPFRILPEHGQRRGCRTPERTPRVSALSVSRPRLREMSSAACESQRSEEGPAALTSSSQICFGEPGEEAAGRVRAFPLHGSAMTVYVEGPDLSAQEARRPLSGGADTPG
jgi:hypothetical protein